ncbi:MAG: rhodanese-like domain-containing protein [Nitriliruptorales bacterium]|nr:rhodanese-like domain-containing protein [Nitriliruptorales bacterium]
MEVIGRERVDELVAEGAQLIEVLPPHQYEHAHLPGAKSLPYKTLDPDTIEILDRDRPVITYCSGFL